MCECEGKACGYYDEFYIPQRTYEKSSAWCPSFNLPPEYRCKHPNVWQFKEMNMMPGVSLNSLKICPKLKKDGQGK